MIVHPVKDSGVDWITVTSAEREKAELLRDHSFAWLSQEEQSGNKIRPWSMSGFNGFHCGGVSFGELNGTWLLRLSGPCAHMHWMQAYRLSTNCSRLDLQVTIAEVANAGGLIQQHYRQARTHFRNWRRPPAVHLWKSNDGSCTLYLNRRCSDQFGRVYDKAIESKLEHYRGCLRYEAEFKGDLSPLVAAQLLRDGGAELSSRSRVHRFFLERGIHPRFTCEPVHTISVPTTAPDVERQLRWLKASVRRSVQDLVSLGKLTDVLESLGLSELLSERTNEH